jgi:hypothetical protein
MGLLDAQFVLQSVEHEAVLEKFPPISNFEPGDCAEGTGSAVATFRKVSFWKSS